MFLKRAEPASLLDIDRHNMLEAELAAVGRPGRLPLLRGGAALSAGLSERAGAGLAAGARGMVEQQKASAKIADVGCGRGRSTILMAQAFPEARFTDHDFQAGSVAAATAHARAEHLENVAYAVGLAQDFLGENWDLVACFDCLHDIGDPVAATEHIRQTLNPVGSWMIVEPAAGDSLEANLNPDGRI